MILRYSRDLRTDVFAVILRMLFLVLLGDFFMC